MGLKKFLRPDELFPMVSFFIENNYDNLDMDIVFNVKDREMLQKINDHIFFTSRNDEDDSQPPRVEGDSINVNIGDYHFIYKCKPSEDADNNNQG